MPLLSSREKLLVAVAVTCICIGLAGGAPHAAANVSVDDGDLLDEDDDDVVTTQITPDVHYSDVNYVGGTMHVTFHVHSDRPQSIALLDSGAALTEGATLRHERLMPGETRISMDVEEVSIEGTDMALMSVTVDDRVYPITSEGEATGLIGGPWGPSDAQAAGVGGAVGVTIALVYVVLKAALGRGEEVQQIA